MENNIQFILHRGSHQIGGNCVELATRNARILIDCGLPLDYDEQDPVTQKEIRENARKWLQNRDAIFLSHYHADHYGLLDEAPQSTKVYTTKETAEQMKISGMFGEDLTEFLDIHPIKDAVIVKTFVSRNTMLIIRLFGLARSYLKCFFQVILSSMPLTKR